MTTLHSVAPQGAGGLKSEHYPSLELCKKLTEAGFGNTEYFWKDYTQGDKKQKIVNCGRYEMEHGLYVYVYPSVMELLDAIPTELLPNALAEMWLHLKQNNYLTK